MLSDKEKLEEELSLLKESYSLDVITKGEYEDAKHRIESKIKELERQESTESKSADSKENNKEPAAQKEFEEEKAEKKDEKETRQKAEIKEEAISEEPKQEKRAKSEKDIAEEESAEAIRQPEQKKEKLAEVPEPEEDILAEISPAEGSKKIYAYAGIALLIVIGLYFFFFAEDANSNPAGIDNDLGNLGKASLIACSSNDDCGKGGKTGICANPGKENSECQYIDDPMVRLTILNGDSCFNCKTERVISMLEGFFPNIEQKSVDIESEEGKQIAEEYGIAALPAYIFDSGIKDTNNYEKLATAFSEVDGSYVMKSTVANSNYYIEREEIKGRLDLVAKPGQLASREAEENLKEFLEAFKGKVIFEKHNSDSKFAKDLGINTFPVFLLNNKIKFNGVQSSEKIKENFCEMNDVDECGIELTQSLV